MLYFLGYNIWLGFEIFNHSVYISCYDARQLIKIRKTSWTVVIFQYYHFTVNTLLFSSLIFVENLFFAINFLLIFHFYHINRYCNNFQLNFCKKTKEKWLLLIILLSYFHIFKQCQQIYNWIQGYSAKLWTCILQYNACAFKVAILQYVWERCSVDWISDSSCNPVRAHYIYIYI